MNEIPFISFDGVFSRPEVAQIHVLAERGESEPGRTTFGPSGLRRCSVARLNDGWLNDRMWGLVCEINSRNFGFLIDCIERPQHITYHVGDHYGWHQDKGPGTPAPRKLSLTVQLDCDGDYEGGDLQIQVGCEHVPTSRHLGAVIAFPSWMTHRVTPVTRGVRRALVVWADGPAFR